MQLRTTVVGHTTASTARILGVFEVGAGTARLAYDDGSGPRSLDVALEDIRPFGRAVFALAGLSASANVRYALAAEADVAALQAPAAMLAGGARSFWLLPTNRPLRVGLVSCNDLTSKQYPPAKRAALWRALQQQVNARNVDLIIHAGDQIYGDERPHGLLPGEDHLEAYRRHYVNTWTNADVAGVLGSCPSVMMWDDHEIYDGYGSNDNDSSPDAQFRFGAATQAFEDFQVCVNPPRFDTGSYAWSFDFNGIGILAVDGRRHRMYTEHRVLGDEQFQALAHTLAALATKGLKHLFVVVGTPPVFVPILAALKLSEAFGTGMTDDLRDGWVSPNNQGECRRFLLMLLNFAASSGTQVSVVAGDIHLGSLGQIDTSLKLGPSATSPRLFQITSSGVARPPPSGLESALLGLVANGASMDLTCPDFHGRLLPLAGSPERHVLTHRNFAILKACDATGNGWDANGNLWVEIFAELEGGIRMLQQSLLRA